MQNVLIIEDFADTRSWLREVLIGAFQAIEVVEAATLAQARKELAERSFDLALVDINLPDGSGIELVAEIVRQSPTTYCVMATIFDDDQHLFPALQAGAQGYLLKEQSKAEFIRSLQGLLLGEPPLSPAIARKILRHFHAPSEQPEQGNLSDREKEILTLVAKGYKRGEIGPMLGITPNTVATHVKTIYGKLNVSSRAEATMEALRLGLIQL